MKQYGIIIDSTVYLSQEEIKKYNIEQVSLNIIAKGETFKELEVDNDFVYGKLDNGIKLTTSQPAPGEFLDKYEEMLAKGYEKLFVICFGEKLSGTYQSAILAKSMLENSDLVHVFNTNSAAYGLELLTLELAELIEKEKPANEIIERLDKLINNSNLLFTLENLISLLRSGRLSKTKAAIGTVLRVKPIIRMVEGKLELVKSTRTHKKITDYVLEQMRETLDESKEIIIRVLSKNSSEHTRELLEKIKEVYPKAKITFNEYLGPLFSLHLGKKGYGVAWTNA